MDDRTLRAAILADVIGFVSVAGIAMFLGVPIVPAVIAGVIAGASFFLLIWLAGRRSDRFHDSTPPTSGDHAAPASRDSTASPEDDRA